MGVLVVAAVDVAVDAAVVVVVDGAAARAWAGDGAEVVLVRLVGAEVEGGAACEREGVGAGRSRWRRLRWRRRRLDESGGAVAGRWKTTRT